MINNSEASKDIASDAFEFIWTHYTRIDKATAKSYLYVYVRNKCIDYLRHQNVHQQYAQVYLKLTETYTLTEYKEYDERMLRIEKAMSTLTAHTRHILEECYIRKKKYQEVAEEMNISVSAVRKHIVKALSVLRQEFAKKGYWKSKLPKPPPTPKITWTTAAPPGQLPTPPTPKTPPRRIPSPSPGERISR